MVTRLDGTVSRLRRAQRRYFDRQFEIRRPLASGSEQSLGTVAGRIATGSSTQLPADPGDAGPSSVSVARITLDIGDGIPMVRAGDLIVDTSAADPAQATWVAGDPLVSSFQTAQRVSVSRQTSAVREQDIVLFRWSAAERKYVALDAQPFRVLYGRNQPMDRATESVESSQVDVTLLGSLDNDVLIGDRFALNEGDGIVTGVRRTPDRIEADANVVLGGR